MRALCIPRKDHDVYCINITGKSKRQQQAYIDEQLLRMHPVYGADTAVDVKKIKHNGHEWAIITVMQKETLEEYRILHPHTAFVTATSLAVFKKDFFTKEVHVCGDERIWFDGQRQLILSEETGEAGISCKPSEIPQKREEPVVHTGWRNVVFSRRQRMYVSVRIGVIAAAVLITYIVWTAAYSARQTTVPPAHQDTAAEIETKETFTVTPSRFLEVIAEHVPAMHAVFERYRYDDTEGALCTFRIRSLATGITEFQTVPHRTGCSIKEIAQKDKENIITLQTEPAIMQPVSIPDVDPAAIAGFTDALKTGIVKTDTAIRRGQKARITMNGLSITLSARVKREFIDTFLHDIEIISRRYFFGMNVLEVVVAESEILSVHAEFRQIGEGGGKTEQITGHVPYTIAHAFGYADKETIQEMPQQVKKTVKKDTVIPEGSVEIGKIKTNGKIKVYYRTPDGKIMIIEQDL